jgi:ferredoxin
MSARFVKWLPVVDSELCTGCGRCVETCGPKSLQIVDLTVLLVRPGACMSEENCASICPEQAIRMDWIELGGDKDRGKWRAEVDIFERIKNHAKR